MKDALAVAVVEGGQRIHARLIMTVEISDPNWGTGQVAQKSPDRGLWTDNEKSVF